MKELIKERGSVYCNAGAWEKFKAQLETIQPSKLFVLTDSNTRKNCLPHFLQNASLSIHHEIIEIPAGEIHKNINTCEKVWNILSSKGADRNSLLINLGGGVVTDLGGFVASTFKRGIEFINIPTSLLAMVDASVGGKNGVDLGMLKNQIGVIRNPLCVLVDTHFLQTLPANQITSGFAEMLKHGLIHSQAYWNSVQSFSITDINKAEQLIWESIEIKNSVVTEDPTEKGIRKTLNYGHTLGHAIESYCLEHKHKNSLLHGEAIAIGMILANYISFRILGFPEEKMEQINQQLIGYYSKEEFNEEDIKAIIELLVYDKKNSHGKVYFVLLQDIGLHKVDCEVPNDIIFEAFEFYKNLKSA